jgi:hypothetical protein
MLSKNDLRIEEIVMIRKKFRAILNKYSGT